LWNYERYLRRYVGGVEVKKSALSGKDVFIDARNIYDGAKFMSYYEMKEYEKRTRTLPLDVNDIKDLDSLVQAISERAYYGGNIVLGNSKEVSESSRCTDSSSVHGSYDIFNGKYIGYCCAVRFGEYIFGCNWVGETKFCISGHETYKDVRCLEMMRFYWCSDCYYCSSVEACTNCMFSFNLRNKSYMVGNVQLQKDEYAKLKDKLVGEMRETLRAKKALPSIIDIINQ
ncbi:MAG: hypothetical protein WC488_05095, partial [Candidatus Micrarchaeia archaeon]